MNKVARNISVAALSVALVFLPACGGSGSTGTTAATVPTKAQFIKQADAICLRLHKSLLAELVRKEKASPESMKKPANQQTFMVAIAMPAVQKEAEEIAALETPTGDEGKVKAIVKGIEEGVKAGKANPAHATEAFTTVGKAAGKYGFKVCTSPL